MAADRVFADTSGLLALAHRQDQYHTRAVLFARKFVQGGGRFVVTPLILAELQGLLLYRRGSDTARSVIEGILGDPLYSCLPVDTELVTAAAGAWLGKFRDQALTLCDGVSFEIMRRERIKSAFGYDRHFADAGFRLAG